MADQAQPDPEREARNRHGQTVANLLRDLFPNVAWVFDESKTGMRDPAIVVNSLYDDGMSDSVAHMESVIVHYESRTRKLNN